MPKSSSRSSKRGVRKARRPKRAARIRTTMPHNDARVNGCDIELTANDATPDEELPKATGGVEPLAVRRRR
jgi:hypothetical protein